MPKKLLFAMMGQSDTPHITLNGVAGILTSVQREDGSGDSFNVSIRTPNGQIRTIHIRTY
jgi:hypothetical protein